MSLRNPEQQTAVLHEEGPILILAGAGSGKTRVITHRIAHLIQKKKVHPQNILAVTFTNKAANEIKHRVGSLIQQNVDRLWIGTFHSICTRILRTHAPSLGYSTDFTIFDDQDSLSLIKKCLKTLNLDDSKLEPKAVLGQINRAKNKGFVSSEFSNRTSNYFEKTVSSIYELYQSELAKNNSMDFGDLLLQTVEIFRTRPEVLTEYQDQFRYVLIDEYQDTNRIQYLFAHSIAKAHKNICAV
ncbi:MAG: UvrD-helicase domain-containing protein, partial [Deltaproteobacteria bacterium]|nr:UvrD-helicase domain-containing protein [Deltaproteobacteria bacterium]